MSFEEQLYSTTNQLIFDAMKFQPSTPTSVYDDMMDALSKNPVDVNELLTKSFENVFTPARLTEILDSVVLPEDKIEPVQTETDVMKDAISVLDQLHTETQERITAHRELNQTLEDLSNMIQLHDDLTKFINGETETSPLDKKIESEKTETSPLDKKFDIWPLQTSAEDNTSLLTVEFVATDSKTRAVLYNDVVCTMNETEEFDFLKQTVLSSYFKVDGKDICSAVDAVKTAKYWIKKGISFPTCTMFTVLENKAGWTGYYTECIGEICVSRPQVSDKHSFQMFAKKRTCNETDTEFKTRLQVQLKSADVTTIETIIESALFVMKSKQFNNKTEILKLAVETVVPKMTTNEIESIMAEWMLQYIFDQFRGHKLGNVCQSSILESALTYVFDTFTDEVLKGHRVLRLISSLSSLTKITHDHTSTVANVTKIKDNKPEHTNPIVPVMFVDKALKSALSNRRAAIEGGKHQSVKEFTVDVKKGNL